MAISIVRGPRITKYTIESPDCFAICFTDTIEGNPIERWAWVYPYLPRELTFEDDVGPAAPVPALRSGEGLLDR